MQGGFTGVEVGLVSGIIALIAVIITMLLARKGMVSKDTCTILHESLKTREEEHYADIKDRMKAMENNLCLKIEVVRGDVEKLRERVDSWKAVYMGEPDRGRRATDSLHERNQT